METSMQNHFSGTITPVSFTSPGDEYTVVNVRIGAVDLDLSPTAAEDMARKLMQAAKELRATTPA